MELGRVDILYETSVMSSYLASPRRGHLERVYGMFMYMSYKGRHTMPMHPGAPQSDMLAFETTMDKVHAKWGSTYGKMHEEFPPHMREPLGLPVTLTLFVDANHARDVVTRRSHTGFSIFANRAPIIWHSKKQNTCETSTFG